MTQCKRDEWDRFIDLVNKAIQAAYEIRIHTDNAGAFNAFQDSVTKSAKEFHDAVFML